MQTFDRTVFDSPRDDHCFSYLLPSTQTLNTTGFKVMQTLAGDGLIAAYRSTLNGNPRLIYDTSNCEPLSALACCLTPSQFAQIARDLFRIFEKIRNNGFIRTENVLLSVDHLMIDRNMGVHLIYLPVDTPRNTTEKLTSLDLTLRQLLTHFIEQNPNVRSERIARLDSILKNPHEPLSSAMAVLCCESPGAPTPSHSSRSPEHRALALVRIGGNHPITLSISPAGTVIGRNPERACAILPDCSVSGAHCKIHFEADQWLVEDLGSVNGTKLNGVRLACHHPAPIKPDDLIEISRYIFTVKEQDF